MMMKERVSLLVIDINYRVARMMHFFFVQSNWGLREWRTNWDRLRYWDMINMRRRNRERKRENSEIITFLSLDKLSIYQSILSIFPPFFWANRIENGIYLCSIANVIGEFLLFSYVCTCLYFDRSQLFRSPI